MTMNLACDEFDHGGMVESSWHQKEELVEMTTAKDMLNVGRSLGAWPVNVWREAVQTVNSGVKAHTFEAIVADYESHASRILGAVGGKYHACDPQQWADLIVAAVKAGAKPVGAFSLREGTRILAVFEVEDTDGWITYLTLCDSFDGSTHLMVGFSSVKVVCMNTYRAWQQKDGNKAAKVRHTQALSAKVKSLETAIGEGIAESRSIREAYETTEAKRLTPDEAHNAFDKLFPPAADGATEHAKTRAENKRAEAVKAMRLPCNDAGDTLATLWNAATYLVDRESDGSLRACRGGADMLDSMLFGQRNKRIAEIQQVIQVIMRDGTVQDMTVSEAVDVGALDGRQVLDAMLDS